MRARILSPEEWARLDGHDLSALLPYVEPQNISIAVVEDEGGQIIACLSAIRVTNLEGTWIAPSHRGHGGVLRALLREALVLPRTRGERWALCGTAAEEGPADEYIRRMGGIPLPGRFYMLPLMGGRDGLV